MSQALILMYHRVTGAGPDPWGLRVTPEHLAEHFEVLGRLTRPVRLRELIHGLRFGRIPPNAVAVTFDDGYADNLQNGQPLLERYGIPATAFLVTGSLESGDAFWWDEVERVLLQPGSLPSALSLSIAGITRRWELGDGGDYSEEGARACDGWRAGEPAPTSRQSIYLAVWESLRPLPEPARREVLGQLVAWAGTPAAGRDEYRLLTPPEVLELAASDLVEIGAHSVTHPMLDALPPERQRWEIEESRRSLAELLGRPVTSFAYPHGAHTHDTLTIVRDAGYECACSTIPSAVRADSNAYRLPRVQVEDWGGKEFERRLMNWFEITV